MKLCQFIAGRGGFEVEEVSTKVLGSESEVHGCIPLDTDNRWNTGSGEVGMRLSSYLGEDEKQTGVLPR